MKPRYQEPWRGNIETHRFIASFLQVQGLPHRPRCFRTFLMYFPSFGGFSSGHQSLRDLTGSLLGGWVSSMSLASMVAQTVENLSANSGEQGSIPGWGRSPGEGHAILSSILAWRITWTEDPGGLQYIVSQRVRHD